MNPNSPGPQGAEAPAPQPSSPEYSVPAQPQAPEAMPRPANPEAPAPQERQPGSMEHANQNAGLPLPQVQQNPLPQPPVQQAQAVSNVQNTTIGTTPVTANDDDVIEKEWVEKAKKIIKETQEDPYVQNKQVTLLRKDYMKKRFDKDIKVASDDVK